MSHRCKHIHQHREGPAIQHFRWQKTRCPEVPGSEALHEHTAAAQRLSAAWPTATAF